MVYLVKRRDYLSYSSHLSLPHVFSKDVRSCNTKGYEAEVISLGTFHNRKRQNNSRGAPAAWGSKLEIKEETFLEDLGKKDKASFKESI